MNSSEASHLIADVDERDHTGRTERLIELTELLPSDGLLGFSGQAAEWLFEDVKATWLYGCFTSTVVTAHAFCLVQLAGSLRLLADSPDLPEEGESLEHLAALAVSRDALDVEGQARLLALHDRFRTYTAANLHRHETRLERHLIESEVVTDEHPLLLDARAALIAALQVVYRRPET
jgi:hypothetical protein